jgi:hypothetical protein
MIFIKERSGEDRRWIELVQDHVSCREESGSRFTQATCRDHGKSQWVVLTAAFEAPPLCLLLHCPPTPYGQCHWTQIACRWPNLTLAAFVGTD